MNFPSLNSQISIVKAEFAKHFSAAAGQPKVVIAPYRITPLGAHVDHQGGEVLGRAIDAYTILIYVPDEGPRVRMRSLNYPGEVFCRVSSSETEEAGDWGRYVRGAAKVLSENYGIQRGIQGMVAGTLPASGLSSSASVGLVFLHGFASVNGLELPPWDYIELDRQLENEYLGLDNGIQDQAMIELSRRDSFVHLDSRSRAAVHVRDHPRAADYRFLVAFSGFPRDLVSTGYNDRVAECKQAARMLGKLGGAPEARILGDVSEEVYQSYLIQLPKVLQLRAQHYFGEARRVREGRTAWEHGDFLAFGQLMTESCESSINNFETGTKEIIALQKIMTQTPGVIGGRFSGGGFGGCTIGLVKASVARTAVKSIWTRFTKRYPKKENAIKVYIAAFSDGVQVVKG